MRDGNSTIADHAGCFRRAGGSLRRQQRIPELYSEIVAVTTEPVSPHDRRTNRLVQPRHRKGNRPSRLRKRSIPETMREGRKSFEPQSGHLPDRSIGLKNNAKTGSVHRKYQITENAMKSAPAYASVRFGLSARKHNKLVTDRNMPTYNGMLPDEFSRAPAKGKVPAAPFQEPLVR